MVGGRGNFLVRSPLLWCRQSRSGGPRRQMIRRVATRTPGSSSDAVREVVSMDTTQAAKFLDALHQPVPRSREGRLLVQLKAIPASREGRPYVRSYPLSALTNGFGFA